MKKRLLKAILLLACMTLSAQDYSFKHYFRVITGHDGLSQTDVKAILQDTRGFMWFGTRNKLNRFDGNAIRVYDCFDPVLNKRNNNISSLFAGHLWVGTDNGVFVFDPLSDTFTFINDTTREGVAMKDWVSDIKEDAYGNIWIVLPNQGLFKYREGTLLTCYTVGGVELPDQGNPRCRCLRSPL